MTSTDIETETTVLPRSQPTIPSLETNRLILRGHRSDDLIECLAMWSDPIVTRFIGGKPSSESQTWARILNYVGHWHLMGFGYWVVEEKATRTFVGEVGFADFKRDITPAYPQIPELGWAFASRAHGKGFATEAVHAALSWADCHLASKRTVCIINPENLASIRVANKSGYREINRTVYNESPIIQFSRG